MMRRGLHAALLMGMLFLNTVPVCAQRVARFAIVIGNNHAEAGAGRDLRYADDDAVATHQLLLQAGVDSTLLVRKDDDTERLYPEIKPAGSPSLSELERTFAAMAARMQQQAPGSAELLVFYSGHGDVDQGEGYVVLQEGRLTRSKLYSLLAQSPAAHNHVFVDACKSYYLAFDRGPGGRHSAYAAPFVDSTVPSKLPNTGFVLSTSSDRDSHEWERFQAGILSHELRSALRGAADVDGDGRVTYAELGAFLTVANHSIPNPRFRPEFTVRAPARDLGAEVLRWAEDVAPLRVTGPSTGHIYVETVRGERILDAHPALRQALTLHLPRERPLFVRRNDESVEYIVARREPVRLETLPTAIPEVGHRGALSLAFEQLFASPFSNRDVAEFRSRADQTRPLDVTTASPKQNNRTLKIVSGTVAIVAAAGGLTLGVVSAQRYFAGAGESQRDLDQRNRSIATLNWASAGLFVVAGAAGLTWFLAQSDSSPAVSVQSVSGTSGVGKGMALQWAQKF